MLSWGLKYIFLKDFTFLGVGSAVLTLFLLLERNAHAIRSCNKVNECDSNHNKDFKGLL